jgi:hypothetical protein
MPRQCYACKKETDDGSHVTFSGGNYFICDDCPLDSVRYILPCEDGNDWFLKNIREAKERRERGQGLWRD